MPAPRFRSRSAKRVQKRTPGGRAVTHYRRKRPKAAHCSSCGKPLGGVPRGRVIEIAKLSKTQRRPQRAFGGVLCHECLRKKIRLVVRGG